MKLLINVVLEKSETLSFLERREMMMMFEKN